VTARSGAIQARFISRSASLSPAWYCGRACVAAKQWIKEGKVAIFRHFRRFAYAFHQAKLLNRSVIGLGRTCYDLDRVILHATVDIRGERYLIGCGVRGVQARRLPARGSPLP
jgi:hypothetical protein